MYQITDQIMDQSNDNQITIKKVDYFNYLNQTMDEIMDQIMNRMMANNGSNNGLQWIKSWSNYCQI